MAQQHPIEEYGSLVYSDLCCLGLGCGPGSWLGLQCWREIPPRLTRQSSPGEARGRWSHHRGWVSCGVALVFSAPPISNDFRGLVGLSRVGRRSPNGARNSFFLMALASLFLQSAPLKVFSNCSWTGHLELRSEKDSLQAVLPDWKVCENSSYILK